MRILFIAEIRGNLSEINKLAEEHGADIVVHTSTFGFYDLQSSKRMNGRTMRKNITTYCPWIDPSEIPSDEKGMRDVMADKMSELPKFIDGTLKFNVPVYTVWGAVEDIEVVEKFRKGEYSVPNLHILDEKTTFVVDGIRICGLGGAFRTSSLFNKGQATLSGPGSPLSLWVGGWQLGELANTLQGTSEPRLFVAHSSVTRNPLLEWFSMAIKANWTVSANLHLPNTGIINRFALDGNVSTGYLALASQVKSEWEPIWGEVEPKLDQADEALRSFIVATNTIYELGKKKSTLIQPYRNTWHFSLSDLACGHVLGETQNGHLSTTTVSRGQEPKRAQRPPARPVHSIFIKTSLDKDQVIEQFSEQDRPLITKVVNENNAYTIHFSSAAEVQGAYERTKRDEFSVCYISKARASHRGRGRGRGRRH